MMAFLCDIFLLVAFSHEEMCWSRSQHMALRAGRARDTVCCQFFFFFVRRPFFFSTKRSENGCSSQEGVMGPSKLRISKPNVKLASSKSLQVSTRRTDLFFSFSFPIPFIIFAPLFSLPPSPNSDPGSHSRLFSPPTYPLRLMP